MNTAWEDARAFRRELRQYQRARRSPEGRDDAGVEVAASRRWLEGSSFIMEDSAMKSRNRWIRSGLIAAAGLLFASSYATAGDSKEKKFHARLEGAQETPAIST